MNVYACVIRTKLTRVSIFPVRESINNRGTYAVAVKCGVVRHLHVFMDGQYMLGKSHKFDSVPDLVHFFQRTALSVHFQDMDVRLLHPCGKMRTLNTADYTCMSHPLFVNNKSQERRLSAIVAPLALNLSLNMLEHDDM